MTLQVDPGRHDDRSIPSLFLLVYALLLSTFGSPISASTGRNLLVDMAASGAFVSLCSTIAAYHECKKC